MIKWSFNHLQIIGKQDEIDKCLNSVTTKESAFDFNAIIPEPESNPDRLTWRRKHWGTDFVDNNTIVAETIPGGVAMWFETDWNPPVPVLLELSKQFPELEFQIYFVRDEIGEGLGRFKNGATLYHEYAELESLDSLVDGKNRLYEVYRSLFAIPGRQDLGLMKWEVILSDLTLTVAANEQTSGVLKKEGHHPAAVTSPKVAQQPFPYTRA